MYLSGIDEWFRLFTVKRVHNAPHKYDLQSLILLSLSLHLLKNKKVLDLNSKLRPDNYHQEKVNSKIKKRVVYDTRPKKYL
jgi:hypothetical protein